jgi:hypothetical protein
MTTTLSNIEKKAIVDQAIRQIDYSIYSSELDILQAEAVTPVDQDQVDAYEGILTKLNAKRSALAAELATLTE